MSKSNHTRVSAFVLCIVLILSFLSSFLTAANAAECPLYGQHQYGTYVQFEADHPHKQYVVCDCGAAKYTGGTQDYYAECGICNPKECQHRHTETYWDTDYWMKYTPVSDTEHQVSGYQYVFCTDCLKHVGDSFPATETEQHNFNGNGDCPDCGYTHACKHERTRLVAIDGFPAYHQHNKTQHIVETRYKRVCRDCGDVVSQIVDSATEREYEDHDFNRNGKCRDCGYIKPEEQKPLVVSVSRGQAAATAGDTITAQAAVSGGDGNYRYAWRVLLDGGEIHSTDQSWGDSYSWRADTPGTYVFAVSVADGKNQRQSGQSQGISVAPRKCGHESWSDIPGDAAYQQRSDSKHKKITPIYRVCQICGETITEYLKEESEDHTFVDGRCTACGLEQLTLPCTHDRTEDRWTDSLITNQGDTDAHIVTETYTVVCLDCGKPIYAFERKVQEAHSFNKNGVCDCGYAQPGPCDHANRKETVLSDPVYDNQGESGHTKMVLVRVECADCGIPLEESKTVTVAELHSFVNGVCVCGQPEPVNTGDCPLYGEHRYGTYVQFEAEHPHRQYVVCDCGAAKYTGGTEAYYAECDICNPKECQHLHTETYWDTDYRMKYTPVSDTEHQVSGYQYVFCADCLKRVGDSFPATEILPHDFNAAGDCPTCGYTYGCKHENKKLVPIDGFPAYHQHDEKHHIYDVQFKEVCTNPACGTTVRNIVESERIYEYQEHRFDANGKCLDCGYIKPEEQKPLSVSVSRGQAAATAGDTITAMAMVTGGDGNYRYSWKVLLDDAEIYMTDLGMGDSFSWKTEIPGIYVFAVFVEDGNNNRANGNSQDISVAQAKCMHESFTDIPGTEKYETISAAKHNKITEIYRVCAICGETISEFLKQDSEDHTFVDGRCTACGLAEPTPICQHVRTEERLTDARITNQGNTIAHIVTETYTVVCLNCGDPIRTFERRVQEEHAFNADGVCACGFAQPTPECDHAHRKEVEIGDPVYDNQGEAGHTKTVTVRVECADCGITLEEAKIVTVPELHVFVNGVCVCGQPEHIHHYEEVVVSKSKPVNVNEEEHVITITYYEYCAGCGDSSEEKTKDDPQPHVFDYEGYEEDHPHHYFKRCTACGCAPLIPGKDKTANGTVQDEADCCICHGHSWGEPYEQSGQWKHSCTKCGLTESVQISTQQAVESECPLYGNHKFDLVWDEHRGNKHYAEYHCDCGKESIMIRVMENCCKCIGHTWSDVFYDTARRQAFQICMVCKERKNVRTENSEIYTAYLDLQSKLGGGSDSYWRKLANNANSYLAQGNGVLGELIKATSQGGSYIYEEMIDNRLFGMDDRSKLMVRQWMYIIADIQEEQSGLYEKVDAASNISDIVGLLADPIVDSAIHKAANSVGNSQRIVNQLQNAITNYTSGTDISSASLHNAAEASLRMDSANANLQSAQNSLRSTNQLKGVLDALPFIFAGIKGVVEGAEYVNYVTSMQKSFEDMSLDYGAKASMLMNIINDARFMSNTELEVASQTFLNKITEEYYRNVAETATNVTRLLDILSDSAEVAGNAVIGFTDGAAKSLSGFATGAVSPFLTIMQASSWLASFTTNADELLDQCERLSILNQMASSTDMINQFYVKNDSGSKSYSVEIWAKLQQIGDDEAGKLVDILMDDAWYVFLAPGGQTLSDFGIHGNRKDVKKLLTDEKKLYQNYIDSLSR